VSRSGQSPVIGVADSILNDPVCDAIRAYVQSLGGEVWGKPIPVGDKWHAVVAVTCEGPLILAEFGVTMGEKKEPKVTVEQEDPSLARSKESKTS